MESPSTQAVSTVAPSPAPASRSRPPEFAVRIAAARLQAEDELRGSEQYDRGEGGHRVAPAHDHGGRDQRADRGGG